MRSPLRTFTKTGMLVVSVGVALTSPRVAVAQKQTPEVVSTTGERRVDVPREARKDPVLFFKPETFKPHVNTIFTAPNALGQKIELTLINVEVFKPDNSQQCRSKVVTESFSLTFKAASKLPQFTSIHKMNHPTLGRFELFLTHRKSDNGDLLYDAVINHIR